MNHSIANSRILQAFNKHLIDFINDLISIYPANFNLKTFKTYVEGFKKVNPKSILTTWQYYVTKKYKTTIYAGNIDFFLKKDYHGDLEEDDDPHFLNMLEKLRKPLLDLSDKDTEKAKKYLINLTKLSELY